MKKFVFVYIVFVLINAYFFYYKRAKTSDSCRNFPTPTILRIVLFVLSSLSCREIVELCHFYRFILDATAAHKTVCSERCN